MLISVAQAKVQTCKGSPLQQGVLGSEQDTQSSAPQSKSRQCFSLVQIPSQTGNPQRDMTQEIRVAGKSEIKAVLLPRDPSTLQPVLSEHHQQSVLRAERKEMRGEVGVAGSLPAKRHESNSRECPPTCNNLVYTIFIPSISWHPPVKKSSKQSTIKDLLSTRLQDWNQTSKAIRNPTSTAPYIKTWFKDQFSTFLGS